ncbi:hypothetical protein FBY37_2841 [Streptomyces sp. SLBN-134]|nr:hypothetical protein FBY37_2841 [Streptomyces sp. SLBN-134]
MAGAAGAAAPRSSRRSPTTACSWSSPRSPPHCRSSCPWRSEWSRATPSPARAGAGTLRYLLVAPAGRSRLLLTKYAAVMTFCLVATLVVAVSALITGALLFPLGDLTTISGTRIGFSEGLARALLIALVVAVSLIGVAALGLFVSTLTNSGIAAMATTVGLLITVQILDQIPQLGALHPYLFSHYWLSFADLMREPVYWDDLTKNLGLQALYAAVFGSAAWARFTAKDITA